MEIVNGGKIHGKLFERPILSEIRNGLNDKKLSEAHGRSYTIKVWIQQETVENALRLPCIEIRVLNIITQQMKLNYWNGDDNLDNNMLWLETSTVYLWKDTQQSNRIGCLCVLCLFRNV